jgi:hypothetical protein
MHTTNAGIKRNEKKQMSKRTKHQEKSDGNPYRQIEYLGAASNAFIVVTDMERTKYSTLEAALAARDGANASA